jgi:hypothetical protein
LVHVMMYWHQHQSPRILRVDVRLDLLSAPCWGHRLWREIILRRRGDGKRKS